MNRCITFSRVCLNTRHFFLLLLLLCFTLFCTRWTWATSKQFHIRCIFFICMFSRKSSKEQALIVNTFTHRHRKRHTSQYAICEWWACMKAWSNGLLVYLSKNNANGIKSAFVVYTNRNLLRCNKRRPNCKCEWANECENKRSFERSSRMNKK